MSRVWPPPQRADRFAVGDVIWWNVPVVMSSCVTWAPDITQPVKVIEIKDKKSPGGHSQLVRVSPNYCPYGDEFDGLWFLPVGIHSHNELAYRERPDVIARREAGYDS